MLLKFRGRHPYIKIFESEHSYLVMGLDGKAITVLGIKDNDTIDQELERINRLQGIRMKQTGQGVPYESNI